MFTNMPVISSVWKFLPPNRALKKKAAFSRLSNAMELIGQHKKAT